MLYTRKGDKGTTKLFDCDQGVRFSKASPVFQVLGTLDELNSSIGFAKALAAKTKLYLLMKEGKIPYSKILEILQENLFCILAEVGGSQVVISTDKVLFLEEVISDIEAILPPIKSFIIQGGGEVGAYLDVIRTIARRAERECVGLRDRGERNINSVSFEYLNRLSSVLYALARFANYQEGYTEKSPTYN